MKNNEYENIKKLLSDFGSFITYHYPTYRLQNIDWRYMVKEYLNEVTTQIKKNNKTK